MCLRTWIHLIDVREREREQKIEALKFFISNSLPHGCIMKRDPSLSWGWKNNPLIEERTGVKKWQKMFITISSNTIEKREKTFFFKNELNFAHWWLLLEQLSDYFLSLEDAKSCKKYSHSNINEKNSLKWRMLRFSQIIKTQWALLALVLISLEQLSKSKIHQQSHGSLKNKWQLLRVFFAWLSWVRATYCYFWVTHSILFTSASVFFLRLHLMLMWFMVKLKRSFLRSCTWIDYSFVCWNAISKPVRHLIFLFSPLNVSKNVDNNWSREDHVLAWKVENMCMWSWPAGLREGILPTSHPSFCETGQWTVWKHEFTRHRYTFFRQLGVWVLLCKVLCPLVDRFTQMQKQRNVVKLQVTWGGKGGKSHWFPWWAVWCVKC